METSLIAFVGGLAVGVVIALLLALKQGTRADLTPPSLDPFDPSACGVGKLLISGTVEPNQDGLDLEGIYIQVVNSLPGDPDPAPPTGTPSQGTTLPITVSTPNPKGVVIVWARYCTYVPASVAFDCSKPVDDGTPKIASAQAASS